ncbi:MarR family transcriptional regulator [Streptomyces sp. S3(2020)]|uniref:MarR family transcriptional regulator n=1 Tax=Streptomyces sp. S3(2020) TaxID=2732044 RepID=UPI001487C79D|nr:MarR family transcriptional regulator [Streptomyces sp. S3(2020)]NNN30345.1 MarR family transcriptional regulator [Streptomyces sp. S3(2020)]
MTTVRTPPPPRLPVRDKAEARDRAWGGVSPMLTRLAAERATGVLVRERGTLHLAEGRVVHAESPLAPGLDVLLTAHGTLDADTWNQAAAEADGAPGAGLLLAGRGRLTRGALELCHLEALYDAAYFALAPSSSPGRFRYTGAGRLGAVHPVTVAALEHETLRRRDLLHRIWPDPATDEAPLLHCDTLAAPGLTARQRAVLHLVDGVRAAPDIARRLGRPAFHTLVDVRRLAAAGVVTRDPAATPGPTTRGTPTPLEVRGPARPSDAAMTDPLRVADPDITLLKRLRDALESL